VDAKTLFGRWKTTLVGAHSVDYSTHPRGIRT
jgi:hypothetical protein